MQRAQHGAARLVLVSYLSLYFELTLIRWIPTQVRLLAYFTNFVLIAALLGLGIGMLLTGRRVRLLAYFPAALLVLTVLVLILERTNFVLPITAPGEFVWSYLYHMHASGELSYLVLIGFFLLLATVFILMGQEVGLALHQFRPLVAYSLNILGSLLGVLGFALVSYLEVPPELWFGLGAAIFGAYLLLSPGPRRMLLTAIPLLLVVGTVYIDNLDQPAGVATYWSPYYKVQVIPKTVNGLRVGYEISVNKDSHQEALNLSAGHPRSAYLSSRERLYNLPYMLVHPHRILVLGAGTGNDVAAALRATHRATVDAVEIDPVIARLGRQIHPERPYSNPRVRLHVDDARSFLVRTGQTYDLAVFGFLDSHRLFSHMSSVRMDNYVYTRENFESVKRRLTPNGITAVTFTVHEKWIADRIYTLLTNVFGHPPLVYEGDQYGLGTTFLVGQHPLRIPSGAPVINRAEFNAHVIRHDSQITWQYTDIQGFLAPGLLSDRATLLTDDWPYLYMQGREIPANYLIVLVLTLAVSILLVWLLVPRIDLRRTSNWNFLFLGAAFALQETKGITDVALLFGSTWITNVIVISAILLVILLANLVVSRWRRIPLRWVYPILFALLVFNFFVPLRGLLEYGFWVQVIASGARVAAPLFFSGIIFARWFERAENPSAALGANLMGAVIGGLSEYSSLALGLNQLYILAALYYLLSFACAYFPPATRYAARSPLEGLSTSP